MPEVSGPELFKQLGMVQAQVEHLTRLVQLDYNPGALKLFHPTRDGTGTALQLDQRLEFALGPHGPGKPDGGVFLQLAKQKPGEQRFDWDDSITAKLGLTDLAHLVAAERCRWARVALPGVFNKGDGIVELFHKADHGSTVIKYQLVEEGALLRVSRAADRYRTMKLTVVECVQVQAYLEQALQGFMRSGKR